MSEFEDINKTLEELALGVTKLQLGAQDGIKTLLGAANARVNQILARQPSDYTLWRLTALQEEIKDILQPAYTAAGEVGEDWLARSWQAGGEAVAAPMRLGLGVQFNALSADVLLAMGQFQTQLISNAGEDVVNRIKSSLAGVVVGIDTPFEAMKSINETLEGGYGMKRAQRIVVTEVGRAYSTASYQRMLQAAEAGVDMQKKWRRSGKIHSRVAHDVIDGQVRPLKEPFVIEGEKIQYPRAPGTSAKQSVNCGCTLVPVVEGFSESQPGRRPFSDEEIRRNVTKRNLEADLSRPAPLDFTALDAEAKTDPEPVKTIIANHVRTPSFVDHVQRGKQGMASHPVAVISAALAQKLGSDSRIVRFSGATAEKQRKNHAEITNYSLVQNAIDGGEVRDQRERRKEIVYTDQDNRGWRLVIKSTQEGDENYLLSWHRLPRRK